MIVSWNWLKQYVLLDMPIEELERRLMMSGLNHEGTEEIGGDLAIDLEVTSNRPDCLGHIGVAREAAVLWDYPLKIPAAAPTEGKTPVDKLVGVQIDCEDLCPRYTARVVRGVKIGPSPAWLARRLETLGLAAVNNVVDISNYVLMECGQPLHTFDFARLKGGRIVVRRPRGGETIEAIDHKTYELTPEMCVIADAEDAVAIGGVMGGAQTEISTATTDILIEAAEFDPLSIRRTSRHLNLHSDSSYRFERRVDPEGVDWASRRCAELILDLCGGELAAGVIDVGRQPARHEPVVLRFGQLKRILGIDVDRGQVARILESLGNEKTRVDDDRIEVVPPSWRGDLTREIDLIEEVARIHGYDKIPEDVRVPMASAIRSDTDRVYAKVRHVLTAAAVNEAMTISAVDETVGEAFSPWTDAAPLRCNTPVVRRADCLRRSLIPSLLLARRTNEAAANREIELFEMAKVYLSRGKKLPAEEPMLAVVSGRDYLAVKGILEAVLETLDPALELEIRTTDCPLLDAGRSAQLHLDGKLLGFLGEVTAAGLKRFGLRNPATVAEVKLSELVAAANLIPQNVPIPSYPAVGRDLNMVVDEAVRWSDVAATVRSSGRPLLENISYQDTYRDPKRLGADKKSLLLTLSLRSREGTLTGEQADQACSQIVAACAKQHGAELRA